MFISSIHIKIMIIENNQINQWADVFTVWYLNSKGFWIKV